MRTYAEHISATCDPKQAIRLAGERLEGVACLHSASVHPEWGRWTVLCARPARIVAAERPGGPDPLAALAESIASLRIELVDRYPVPFVGGWVGWLGYEAGRFLEDLPARTAWDVSLPAVRFGLYGSAAVYDHLARQWYVTGVELPEPAGGLAGREGMRAWSSLLHQAERVPLASRGGDGNASIEETDAFLAGMQPSLSDPQFLAAVERAVCYIGAGDIYQVNLARRLTAALPRRPLDLYLRLCETNPAWYAAYIDAGPGRAVLSSSPELFLRLEGREVVARPIKGTRPRVGEPAGDARARRELLASEKDRAELTMIVDLERNDLGRVCEFGSVQVVEPFGLEEHPTVYHLVGTIRGRLREGVGPIDLLRATFPGGSITGAPKIRAMQIIDELEPVARNVYCGSIGWIGLDGSMNLNIAIRTLLADGPRVHLYVGGGIVADSRPELELAETVAKARGMARALL